MQYALTEIFCLEEEIKLQLRRSFIIYISDQTVFWTFLTYFSDISDKNSLHFATLNCRVQWDGRITTPVHTHHNVG